MLFFIRKICFPTSIGLPPNPLETRLRPAWSLKLWKNLIESNICCIRNHLLTMELIINMFFRFQAGLKRVSSGDPLRFEQLDPLRPAEHARRPACRDGTLALVDLAIHYTHTCVCLRAILHLHACVGHLLDTMLDMIMACVPVTLYILYMCSIICEN